MNKSPEIPSSRLLTNDQMRTLALDPPAGAEFSVVVALGLIELLVYYANGTPVAHTVLGDPPFHPCADAINHLLREALESPLQGDYRST